MKIIKAQTHTPEYMIHKYWARKPHNVLCELIQQNCKVKSIVLDPFCGSGVFLNEAAKLGHKTYGFDINPTAYLLSKVTCSPPSLESFKNEMDPLLEKFQNITSDYYKTSTGENIKYFVHDVVTKCNKCNKKYTKGVSLRKGNKYFCEPCDERLSFGLEKMIETKIVEIVTHNGSIKNKKELLKVKKAELEINPPNKYDKKFIENNRILSFKGLSTKKLFTSRNFLICNKFADEIHKIKDEKIKDAALLMFTGSIAQSSRLIAYRNNLKSGGPAWSVPGFWVPSKHIESNPYNHIFARYKKLLRGIESLDVKKEKVFIYNEDSLNIQKRLKSKVDLIFLDPPYGDSIPYLEFSMIWNSFLKIDVDINNDISVSDRSNQLEDPWDKYRTSLIKRVKVYKESLSKNGKIIITFNNHDLKAWSSLLESLQSSSFVCKSTIYQAPAVVSSKAQFSKSGSYISDIYSVFKHEEKYSYSRDLSGLKKTLINCALAREGVIQKNLLFRTAFTYILKNNISYMEIFGLNKILKDHFMQNKNEFTLKDIKHPGKSKSLLNIVKDQHGIFKKKKIFNWDDFYKKITILMENKGVPDEDEVWSCLVKLNLYPEQKKFEISPQQELKF